jgi:hypothetical protein
MKTKKKMMKRLHQYSRKSRDGRKLGAVKALPSSSHPNSAPCIFYKKLSTSFILQVSSVSHLDLSIRISGKPCDFVDLPSAPLVLETVSICSQQEWGGFRSVKNSKRCTHIIEDGSNEQLGEVRAQDIEDRGDGVNGVYGVNIAITGDLLDESTGVALIQRLVGDRHLHTAGYLPNREGQDIRVGDLLSAHTPVCSSHEWACISA